MAISQDSSIMKRLKDISKSDDIDLLIPYIERDNLDIYSSCVLIVKGNIDYNYRRISTGWKVKEKANEFYKEGTKVKEFHYKNKKFILALCGDLWLYPEKIKSDSILIWLIYVNFEIQKWEEEKIEYAKQANMVTNTALLINSISSKPDSVGGSFLFKEGNIVTELGFSKEAILRVIT